MHSPWNALEAKHQPDEVLNAVRFICGNKKISLRNGFYETNADIQNEIYSSSTDDDDDNGDSEDNQTKEQRLSSGRYVLMRFQQIYDRKLIKIQVHNNKFIVGI